MENPHCRQALIWALFFMVSLAWSGMAHAQEAKLPALGNAAIEVRYDPTGTLELLDKATGKSFTARATAGIAGGVVTPTPQTEKGVQEWRIAAPDGDALDLRILDGSPFVFIRWQWGNPGKEARDRARVTPLHAVLTLEKPAKALKVLGTKGLTGPEGHPGSYSFLAVADPETNAGVVAGWVTEWRASGLLMSSSEEKQVALDARLDYGPMTIPPGETLTSEWLALGFFLDARLGLEQYADAAARFNSIQLPPQISGYCTWYSKPHGGASDQTHIGELSRFCADTLKPFGLDFIQIDDLWQGNPRETKTPDFSKFDESYLGKPIDEPRKEWWWGPHSDFTQYRADGPYSEGMAPTAARLGADGFRAGLWLMPFAWDPLCDALKDHHDYFVHRADGGLYYTMWSGWCLDMTHPDARAFLAQTVDHIVRGWGFRYLKLDGLYSGVAVKSLYVNEEYKEDGFGRQVFHDPRITPIEAYRTGLETVRKAAGKDVFILGCNVSQNMRTMGASFGLVDAMRIGPDNGSGWNDLKSGPWHGTNRYFLHGRVWYNDPDPVYIRPDMPLEHARLLCSWAGVTGQFTVSSDWLPTMPAERLDLLKRVLPAHGKRPRPVDLFERDFPRVWVLEAESGGVQRQVIGCFNWDEHAPAKISYPAAALGLSNTAPHAVFDYWGNTFAEPFTGTFAVEVPPASCQILAVRPVQNQPFVLSTSRHVSQGIVDIEEEAWDATERVLHGRSRVVAGDPYELRIFLPPNWTATGAGEGVITQKEGQLRVLYSPSATGTIEWRIAFSHMGDASDSAQGTK